MTTGVTSNETTTRSKHAREPLFPLERGFDEGHRESTFGHSSPFQSQPANVTACSHQGPGSGSRQEEKADDLSSLSTSAPGLLKRISREIRPQSGAGHRVSRLSSTSGSRQPSKSRGAAANAGSRSCKYRAWTNHQRMNAQCSAGERRQQEGGARAGRQQRRRQTQVL